MSNEARARFWGMKAAQAGLSEANNPFRSANDRRAWSRGRTEAVADYLRSLSPPAQAVE